MPSATTEQNPEKDAKEPKEPERKAPEGWRSADAYDLAEGALKALKAGNLEQCIAKNKASLAKEERPRTHVVLARCEEKSKKFVDALKDLQRALELGPEDAELVKMVRPRREEILRQLPRVTFVPRPGSTLAELKLDDQSVPVEALAKKMTLDPAKHHVVAIGSIKGVPATYETDFDVKAGASLTVRLNFKAAAAPPATVPAPALASKTGAAKTDTTPVDKPAPDKAQADDAAPAKEQADKARVDNGPRPDTGELQCISASRNEEEARRCVDGAAKNASAREGRPVAGLR